MADIGIGIGTSIVAAAVWDTIKKYYGKKIKGGKDAENYNETLEKSIRDASKKLSAQEKPLAPNVERMLKDIFSNPADLLSSPAIHKNEFMKRLSDTTIPEELRHKIFDEIETTFFKSLYEDAFKNDEEFRKTVVSRINEALIRQNKSAATEDQILNALNNFAKKAENWKQMLAERIDRRFDKIDGKLDEIVEKLDSRQTKVNEEITTQNKRLQEQKNELSITKMRLSEIQLVTRGVSRINGENSLRQYYSVEEGIEPIVFESREKDLNDLESKIMGWSQSDKPIFLVTGPAGAGKSWFCYELLLRLSSTFDIFKIQTEKFLFDSNMDPDDCFCMPHVFILDDNFLSVGEKQITRITSEDLVRILSSRLERDSKPPSGPLILSMKLDTWEAIISSKIDSGRLNALVDQTKLSALSSKDARKLIASFNGSASRIKVSGLLANQIAEKTMGLPLLIKLFFNYLDNSKFTENEDYEVTIDDVAAIKNTPAKYLSELIFDYYLSYDQVNQNAHSLALLSLIASLKEVPKAFLRYLSENDNYKITRNFFAGISAPPLYEITQLGMTRAFHESVNETVNILSNSDARINLIRQLGNEPIGQRLRNLNWNAKQISQDVTSTRLKWKDELFGEIRKFLDFQENLTLEEYFDLLSLVIMVRRNYSLFKEDEFSQLMYEFENFLKNNFQDFKNKLNLNFDLLNSKIIEQLAEIIFNPVVYIGSDIRASIYRNLASYKNFYLILMASNVSDVKTKVWNEVPGLIDRHILERNYVRQYINDLMVLLNQEDMRTQVWVWSIAWKLLSRNVIDTQNILDHSLKFAKLLNSKNSSIRSEAWYLANSFAGKGLLYEIEKDSWFFSLLKNPEGPILESWDLFEKIVLHSLTNRAKSLQRLEELLRQENYVISCRAWNLMLKIAVKGLVHRQIIANNIDKFESLLSEATFGEEHKEEAWLLFEKMIRRSLIDDQLVYKCLSNLLLSEIHRVRLTAQVYISRWTRAGIIGSGLLHSYDC